MHEQELRLLLASLGGQILESQSDPTGAVAVLVAETIKFRDQLRRDTGTVLTVGDTREALGALESYLGGKGVPSGLSAEQGALVQLYIDRLILFRQS
ncbi:MAG: hypothetical protein HY851_05540 [candidate division Zixibacteria bacterium]|nr:hypothetical protein [candidate division Zixibacteria bacterium]